MTLKKYLDAEDFKKKIKNVKHVSDIEKLIDSESDNMEQKWLHFQISI